MKKIFLICFLSLLFLPKTVHVASYPVEWNPGGIEQTVGLGGTKDLSVTFTSNTKLQNVDLWVVPELQPFVNVEPEHFDTIEINTPYHVIVHIFIPYGTQNKMYDGTVHLRIGSETYPQTLKVKLNIECSNPELELISAPKVAPVDVDTPIYLFFQDCEGDVTTFHDIDISPSGVVTNQYWDASELFGLTESDFTWFVRPTTNSERGTYTKYYSLIDADGNESNVIIFKFLVPQD